MEEIEAVVTNVVHSKNYVVTRTKEEVERTVTFTITPRIWKSEIQPHNGMIVELRNVYMTELGWRADQACPKQK